MDIIINADCSNKQDKVQQLSCLSDFYLHLLHALGYPADNLPLADFLRQHHKLEGNWLIVSPVHWSASHNNAIIDAYETSLGLLPHELQEAFHAFTSYLNEDGHALYYHNHWLWLISATGKSIPQAMPVYAIINQPLLEMLLMLDVTHYWQGFLTSAQMFFNAYKQDSLLNGVWLWGGGTFMQSNEKKICAVPEYAALASSASKNVDVYYDSIDLSKYDILLCHEYSQLSLTTQNQLKKLNVCWYWNNNAYSSKKEHCLIRFWNRITNAN